MGAYAGTGTVASGSNLPILCLWSDGTVQPELEALFLAMDATVNDRLYLYDLFRLTDAGSGGTAITPEKRIPCAASSASLKKGTFAGAPTKTGISLLPAGAYLRTPRQFFFNPGQLRQIVITAANGWGLWNTTAPSTDNVEASKWWTE